MESFFKAFCIIVVRTLYKSKKRAALHFTLVDRLACSFSENEIKESIAFACYVLWTMTQVRHSNVQ